MAVHAGCIVVAAGRGERMHAGVRKALIRVGHDPHGGERMALLALAAASRARSVSETVMVVAKEDVELFRRETAERRKDLKLSAVVAGGKRRLDSVRAGLAALSAGISVVLVHDGARPLASPDLFDRIASAVSSSCCDGVIPVLPVVDTVKRVSGDGVVETLDRSSLVSVQTPQGFRREVLEEAHRAAEEGEFSATDDAALVEALGKRVTTVPGEPSNIKLTTKDDLARARFALGRGQREGMETAGMRTGFGFDSHRMVAGRPLMLGGIELPSQLGAAGHSDADTLIHAVIDALLGAAGLGDIGTHFPDTDPAFKNAAGIKLLKETKRILEQSGWRAANIDATVVIERPKLADSKSKMARNIAEALALPPDCVSVKAKTPEGLGPDAKRAVAAYAVASVRPI